MKVFVSGATGVIGRRVVAQLKRRGDQAVGLARSQDNERIIREAGGTPRRGDLFDFDDVSDAMRGCDAAIHAATALRGLRRPGRRRLGVNDRVRREGTDVMTRAVAENKIPTFLLPSVVWLCRPRDGSAFDESAPHVPDNLTGSLLLSERLATTRAAEHDFNAQIVRLGWLYSSDSDQLRRIADGLAKGRMGVFGSGAAKTRLLHADDAASALVTALKYGKPGVWHVVDDRAVTVLNLMESISQRLGARPPVHLPKALGYPLLGKALVDFFNIPTQTTAKRFKADTGWKPKYPTMAKGLDQILAAWTKEGFPSKIKPPKTVAPES